MGAGSGTSLGVEARGRGSKARATEQTPKPSTYLLRIRTVDFRLCYSRIEDSVSDTGGVVMAECVCHREYVSTEHDCYGGSRQS